RGFLATEFLRPLAGNFAKMPLCLRARLRALRFQTTIAPVRLQLPCFDAVVQKSGKHLMDNMIAQRRSLDWKRDFDAAEKVSRHPISAGEKQFGLAAVFKVVDPAVLKKPADNADDANVFAQTGNLRPQTTDAAHDQIDRHFRGGGFIECLDDLLIDQRIEFGDDS